MESNELIQIKCEQDSVYKSVFFLNGLRLKKDKLLFKYMPYSRLDDCIHSSKLTFVSPDQWLDPFERRFWKTDFSRYNYYQPEIACMCFTGKSTTNEEAAWRIYSDDREKLFRVSFNIDKLLSALNTYAQEHEYQIYIGKAIYSYNRKQIMHLHDQDNEFFPVDTERFTLCHYLSLMCIKRNSFLFENEIRIFIVGKQLNMTDSLLKIPITINNTFIPTIVIAPLSPYGKENWQRQLYNMVQNAESQAYKIKLGKLIPQCKIIQSQLYVSKDPLKTV